MSRGLEMMLRMSMEVHRCLLQPMLSLRKKLMLLQRLQRTAVPHLPNPRLIPNRSINQNRITSKNRATNQSLVISLSPSISPLTTQNPNPHISHGLTTSQNHRTTHLRTKRNLITSQSHNLLTAPNPHKTPLHQHLHIKKRKLRNTAPPRLQSTVLQPKTLPLLRLTSLQHHHMNLHLLHLHMLIQHQHLSLCRMEILLLHPPMNLHLLQINLLHLHMSRSLNQNHHRPSYTPPRLQPPLMALHQAMSRISNPLRLPRHMHSQQKPRHHMRLPLSLQQPLTTLGSRLRLTIVFPIISFQKDLETSLPFPPLSLPTLTPTSTMKSSTRPFKACLST